MKTMLVAVVLACSGATLAHAAGLSSKEQAFLREDVRGGVYETQLSQMALQKSSNTQIKQFAQTDMTDHQALLEQARKIALMQGVNLPVEPSQQERDKLTMLSQQSGHAFDEAYVQAMKTVNEQDAQSAHGDASDVDNPELKQYMQSVSSMDSKHKALVDALPVGN